MKGRGRISSRGGARQNQRVRAIVEGNIGGGRGEQQRRARELGYRTGRGIWCTRDKEGNSTAPLGRSTPEEEYARERSDSRTNGTGATETERG